ncbi:hypothetical protein ACWN8P_01095 [Vagococcus salmoninarum]|uniref:Coproporphyrinogen III oxidase n=1 Tax=Vagococcus salmoninarum TaxID=2739 RepID=A0A429ZVV4_9ENTE|nr:hypothetical protein [Vagococcus salmoninarum]RST97795.1 hypothetical protein CBF35_00440 [Vagococcus salmoninarum]
MSNVFFGFTLEKQDETIQLDVDLLNYMLDSLYWINTTWVDSKTHQGFDMFGVSTISEDIPKFKHIISSWINVFELGTDKITLTVDFDIHKLDFQRVTFNKKDVLKTLMQIVSLCDKAISTQDSIMVLGI